MLKYDHIAERGSTSVGLHTFMYAPLPRETFSDSVALYPTPFQGLLGGSYSTGCAPHGQQWHYPSPWHALRHKFMDRWPRHGQCALLCLTTRALAMTGKGGRNKLCASHGQQWQRQCQRHLQWPRQCAPHLHKGGDVLRTGFVFLALLRRKLIRGERACFWRGYAAS